MTARTETNVRLTVLDPTVRREAPAQGMAPRPATLNGSTVGLLANQKLNAEPLLEAIYDVLAERFDIAGRRAVNKGDAGSPADPALLDRLASEVDVVITANGD